MKIEPKHIVTFSGGKDSQATCIWAKNNLKENWSIAFCDTVWESSITYQFILEFEALMQKESNHLRSKKYKGFIDLAHKKKRFPSTRARFCTEELKMKPMIDYILDEVATSCVIYQGIRWEESPNRSKMESTDCYFLNYYEPIIKTNKKTGEKKEKYHSYRKKEVLEYLKKYEATVKRPIISWSGTETIQYILDNGYKYNPLYDLGFSRVGCFPCIMCTHGEIKLIIDNFPERIKELKRYEEETNSTFFPPNYIPSRYCSKSVLRKKTREYVKVPTIEDVVKYIKARRMKQQSFFVPTCKNVYVPCE